MTTKSSTIIGNPVYPIMFAIGGVHLLNDSLQAVIPAMFPILEKDMGLTFTQLGLIAFALNMVASVLQPVVGYFSDRKPRPYALPIGMTFSFVGIAGLAFAPEYWMILVFVMFLGLGSAVFIQKGPGFHLWQLGQEGTIAINLSSGWEFGSGTCTIN